MCVQDIENRRHKQVFTIYNYRGIKDASWQRQSTLLRQGNNEEDGYIL